MKKIVLSLAVIAIVGVVAVGVTRAYFSDTAVVTGNSFTAGTMAIQIDSDPSSTTYAWSDGFTNPANPFANVVPGDTGEQIVDIRNLGNVDGVATIQFDTTAWSALGDNLNFTVTYDGNHDGTFETAVASGPLTTWNHNVYTLGMITGPKDADSQSGRMASVKIEWSVPTTAGNNIQGQSITLNTTFGLTQAVPTHVTSAVLNYGPTGWAGWSCPTGKTVVDGSLVVTGGDLASTYAWKTGATVSSPSVTYPATPFGYTFGTGETGYIGQNDNDSGESIVLNFDCI